MQQHAPMTQNQRVAIALFACLVAWLTWQDRLSWQQSHQRESYETAAKQSDKKTAEITPEEQIAKYTWWLALLTGCLVGVAGIQGYFLLRSDKTARIIAESAKRSADATIAIELPIIQIVAEKVGFGTAIENDRPFDYFWISELIFSNLGRTKAFPIEIQCGWTEGDSLPKVPRYTYSKQFQIGVIFEPNAKPSQLYYNDMLFESDLGFFNRVRDQEVKLWFYCSLAYLDFMQNRHDVGFCWRRHEFFGGGKFIADPSPAYNRKT
jgi:hypothetical protein